MRGQHRKYVVTPVVPQWLALHIGDVAHQRSVDSADVARSILLAAYQDIEVLDQLAPYFWRDYQCRGRTWLGSSECMNLNELIYTDRDYTEVLHIPLTQHEWFRVDNVAYSLCRSIHQTAAALLLLAVHSGQHMLNSGTVNTTRSGLERAAGQNDLGGRFP